MTYDPIDTDGDGTIESDIDNNSTSTGSLDTERAGITKVSERPTEDELPAGLYNLDGQIIMRSE